MRVEGSAPLRGTAAGLLTAALAVAAHGSAGGAIPAGAVSAHLVVLAATVGALTAGLRAAASPWVLIALLSAGQLLGHLLFSAAGHTHGPPAALPAMVFAHTVAVVAGAVLIAAVDRLGNALSKAVRAIRPVRVRPVAPRAPTTPVRSADQPLRALMLAASVARRGPPVGAVP
ncbi:hypothetical protein [Mycolicibacterium thermoresistibile]